MNDEEIILYKSQLDQLIGFFSALLDAGLPNPQLDADFWDKLRRFVAVAEGLSDALNRYDGEPDAQLLRAFENAFAMTERQCDDLDQCEANVTELSAQAAKTAELQQQLERAIAEVKEWRRRWQLAQFAITALQESNGHGVKAQ